MSASVLRRLETGLPAGREAWDNAMGDTAHPQAAVLVALTEQAEPGVLLGRRTRHLAHHPGEIAFAGGKREPVDVSPWQTASREAREEVGLAEAALRPLGELAPMLTRTGFEVFPCVAAIAPDPVLEVDPGEFDSVFFTPLSVFADAALLRLEVMSDGNKSRKVPHYTIGSDNIWGVTAAVLALLANVAYDAGLDLQRDWKQPP